MRGWRWATADSENGLREVWDQFGDRNYGGVVIHRGRAYTITVGDTSCESVSEVADREFGR